MTSAPESSATRARRWRLMLAYALLLLPVLVLGASRALEANNNSPMDWVTDRFPPKAAYEKFCDWFGPGDTVVASWPGCTLYEERLDTLVRRLETDERFFDATGDWYFHDVVTGREAGIALTAPVGPGGAPAMTPDEAIDRMLPSLVGPDRRTTALVATFTSAGLAKRGRLVDALRDVICEVTGLEPADLHLAGPVIDGLSVDRASQSTLARHAGPSAALVFLLCWASVRSLRAAVCVFGLAAFCQAATLALVHYSGESMTALLIVLPPMVQVLAVAGGLHLTNYYFDSGEVGERGAIDALRSGWAPSVLSSATTVVGMGSLIASELTPIRQFGAYAAAGVALSTAVLLGLLPALYAWAPPPRPRGHGSGPDDPLLLGVRASVWSAAVDRFRGPIVLAGLTAIVAGGFYAARVRTSVRIDTLFSQGSRVLEDCAWIERHVAKLASLEVVVSVPRGATMSQRDKLAMIGRVGEALREDESLGDVVSAATFAPPAPNFASLPGPAQTAAEERFADSQGPLQTLLGLKTIDADFERWRLTTRTTALGEEDYGELLGRVRERVEGAIEDEKNRSGVALETTVTGVMPLVHEVQRRLLGDLLTSFAGALVLITLVMTLVQAGVGAGLVAMASNVFPIAIYFGWLGWRGHPIDIGIVMTASVALGIAVDDTLHFLSFYRRVTQSGVAARDAVRESLARCAPAMIQTSVSCGLGLLAFALSDFLPTRGFAISMAVLLALALAGDLLLLPALLIVTGPRRGAEPAGA